MVIADSHCFVLSVQEKTIFLDVSKSDKMLSRVVEWLQKVSKACVKSFLNKHVDITISDREEITRRDHSK